MTNIRAPKDSEEWQKACIAVSFGMGRRLEDVVEEMLGEKPDEAFLEAIKNRIAFAHESGEEIDFDLLVEQMKALQEAQA